MNISRTAGPSAAAKMSAPNSAENKKQITIKMPSVDSVSIADTAWKAVDGVGTFAARSGGAALAGVGSAVPILGLKFSLNTRESLKKSPEKGNAVNHLSNAATGLAQVGGLGTFGLSALSLVSGVGSAGSLFKASCMCFAAAGVAGVVTGFASESAGDLMLPG